MMVRIEETAEDSLAAIRARIKLGMAMAAIMSMIATTISNSISENPLSFCIQAAPSRAVILHNYTTTSRGEICIPGATLARQPQAVKFYGESAILLKMGLTDKRRGWRNS